MTEDRLFNVVLVNPCIPQNTGNIGRLCVNTNCRLHVILPVPFSFEDKYIRRAGLDYWEHLDIMLHDSAEDFFSYADGGKMFFFSTKGDKSLWDCPYGKGAYLIFGNEESGLPADFYEIYKESLYTIPMPGANARSLNLANAAAVVVYEGIRRYLILEIGGT